MAKTPVLGSGKKIEPIYLGISLHLAGRTLEKHKGGGCGSEENDRVQEKGPSPQELRIPRMTHRMKDTQPSNKGDTKQCPV